MTFKEAIIILDNLHEKYPKLKKMSAQATADFVRTLPPEEHDPVDAAANFIAQQSYKDVILRLKQPSLN